MDTISWLLLLGGAVAIVFYALVMAFAFGMDREEEAAAFQCQDKIWELFVNGEAVDLPDMDEEECQAFLGRMDEQTEPFTPIECRWRYVCRQEL